MAAALNISGYSISMQVLWIARQRWRNQLTILSIAPNNPERNYAWDAKPSFPTQYWTAVLSLTSEGRQNNTKKQRCLNKAVIETYLQAWYYKTYFIMTAFKDLYSGVITLCQKTECL